MQYSIVPNRQTPCEDDFGNGLSYFFEQVGGYGDKAEVEQVSRLLEIDLSVFQDVEYVADDSAEIENHWHDLDSFIALVDDFMARIRAHPDYYKKVKHNPNKEKQDEAMSRALYAGDSTQLEALTQKLQSDPLYEYPPERGYLKEGRLLKDLKTLRNTLDCYKKNGVTKVRLEYA